MTKNVPGYSVEEAAEILDVSEKVLRQMLEKQRLPGFKAGRNWRIPGSIIQMLLEGKQLIEQNTQQYRQKEGLREYRLEEIEQFVKEDQMH